MTSAVEEQCGTGALERKLDLLIALLRVAHQPALDRRRAELEDDPLALALLRGADESARAGELKKLGTKASKQSVPTVERKIAALVKQGALAREGSGSQVKYRNTGLFTF